MDFHIKQNDNIKPKNDTVIQNNDKTLTSSDNLKTDDELESEKEKEKESENTVICEWTDIPDINNDLLRGIYAIGFEKPSPIQSKAILPVLNNRDIIAQAQSGTGKTGAFAISTLQKINVKENTTQALVLAPTRELAIQIKKVFCTLSEFMNGINIKLMIGGTSFEFENRKYDQKPHIVIGCTGRIHDMIKRRRINTSTIKILVMDEADEMLSTGFKEQVYNIFQFLSKDVQVCLYSATLPSELQYLTDKFMQDPVKILVKTELVTLEGISQYYIALESDMHKFETIKDIFNRVSVSQCIIYCNSVKRVAELTEAMLKDDFAVSCIHSGMEKDERTKAYEEFVLGKTRVLISSNVTARGIDVQQVSTVINFDIPKDIHTYIHRIGRSGRWGRKGVGINFITEHDVKKIRDIEQYYDTQINELPTNF
jgi:translation initiation factor 4A